MTWWHVPPPEGHPWHPDAVWDEWRGFLPCTTPTPDPASPCGECGQPSRASVHDHVGLGTPIGGAPVHFPTPTRCLTCGHPIEEARP